MHGLRKGDVDDTSAEVLDERDRGRGGIGDNGQASIGAGGAAELVADNDRVVRATGGGAQGRGGEHEIGRSGDGDTVAYPL